MCKCTCVFVYIHVAQNCNDAFTLLTFSTDGMQHTRIPKQLLCTHLYILKVKTTTRVHTFIYVLYVCAYVMLMVHLTA